jgi:hypothetical protein
MPRNLDNIARRLQVLSHLDFMACRAYDIRHHDHAGLVISGRMRTEERIRSWRQS